MTTYSRWLEMQTGRDDMIGEVAKIWAAAGQTGNRPKAHSPVGITNWFREQYHEQPERFEQYRAAIEAGMTERQREATAHLHAVPAEAAGGSGDIGEQVVSVLKAMQLLLEAHGRQLEAISLAVGIDPADGAIPPRPDSAWPLVSTYVTSSPGVLPDGDLSTVWPELWAAADHSAEEA